MRVFLISSTAVLLLSSCVGVFQPKPPLAEGAAAVAPAPRPPSGATTADQFDTTTEAERQAATAPAPAGGRELGRTIASLGNPADPGFWLETPLVTEKMQGRVVYEATGKSVTVELRPIAGAATAGSRISLPALRLLGAPLTGLPELTVFAG